MSVTLLAGALISLPRAHAYLELKVSSAEQDALLEQFINYATAKIEGRLRRKLLSRTYTGATALICSGRGTQELLVPEYPVTTITAARERYNDGTGAKRTINVTGAYVSNPYGFLIFPLDAFGSGEKNVELDCIAGYLAGTHDSEIAALEIVAARYVQVLWQDKVNALGRAAGVTVAGQSINLMPDAIPKDIVRDLEMFERPI